MPTIFQLLQKKQGLGDPTYTLTASSSSVDEGTTISITLITERVIDGTQIDLVFYGTGITASDFQDGTLINRVTVINGSASYDKVLAEEGVFEIPENFTVRAQNPTSGVVLGTMATNITIIDQTPPFYTSASKLNHIQMSYAGGGWGGKLFSDGNSVIVGYPSKAGGTSSATRYSFSGSVIRGYTNPNDFDTNVGDRFGQGVGFTSKWTVIGAPGEDEITSASSSSGVAYVYSSGSTVNKVLRNPNASQTKENDGFGECVAVSGDYAAVSAPFEDISSATLVGVVYIFDLNTGTKVKTIWDPNATGTVQQDQFGHYTVEMANNHLIVGSWLEDVGANNAGVLYVFKTDTGLWNDTYLLHTLTDPTPTNYGGFGLGCSFDGRYIFAGTPGNGAYTGKVRMYDLNSATPTVPVYTFTNPNPSGYSYGRGISHKGTTLVIGAPGNNSYAGQAYIYSLNPTRLGELMTTINNPNIDNTNSNDYFGTRVKTNGTHVCIAAPREDWTFNNATAEDSGTVYWFQLNE